MDFSYDEQVGGQIRRLREGLGLTQEQLAARLQVRGCDMTRSALAKIEAGRRHIYLLELRCLRDALETTCDVLLQQAASRPSYLINWNLKTTIS